MYGRIRDGFYAALIQKRVQFPAACCVQEEEARAGYPVACCGGFIPGR